MALTAQHISKLNKTLTQFKLPVVNKGKVFIIQTPKGNNDIRKTIIQSLLGQLKDAPWNAILTKSSSAGSLSLNRGEIEIVTKPQGMEKKTLFKPIDINPSIVNNWIDPDTMVKNVITHVKSVDIPELNKQLIINLVKATAENQSTSIPLPKFPKDIVPAEFFEVLSALKMTVLLKNNNAKIKKVLGIPVKTDMSRVKAKIFIPQESAFPLVDYFIGISADKMTEKSAIKISVKSKAFSAKTNTVKFKDMFDKQTDIDRWYNELETSQKRNQKGQKLIAEGVRKAYDLGGGRVALSAPCLALINLIKSDRPRIEPILKTFGVTDVTAFGAVLQKILELMRLTRDPNPLFGSFKLTAPEMKLITKFITTNIRDSEEVLISLVPFCYVCDKVLVESSRERSTSKYNFYQMFYDEILKRRHVAYAVSTFTGGVLNYNFYTQVNWAQEYHDWIALRSLGNTKQFIAPIGLDV